MEHFISLLVAQGLPAEAAAALAARLYGPRVNDIRGNAGQQSIDAARMAGADRTPGGFNLQTEGRSAAPVSALFSHESKHAPSRLTPEQQALLIQRLVRGTTQRSINAAPDLEAAYPNGWGSGFDLGRNNQMGAGYTLALANQGVQ